MKLKLATPLLAALAACSSNNPPLDPDGGNPDGGPPPVQGTIYSLDATAMDQKFIAMAVGPNNRVGVAYFKNINSTDYAIKYVEWQNGTVGAPETVVPALKRVYGLTMAFQNNGQPAISYLGGSDDGMMSQFWYQSDVAISYRQPSGTWLEYIAVRLSNEAVCGNPVSDSGFVVGLYPALAFVGTTAYLAYRDVHDGQFPQQDYNGSDLELVSGSPSGWTHRPIVCGGDDKQAYGGHSQMVLGAQGQPAIVSDQQFGLGPEVSGTNVLFHKRNSDGSWTGTPPSTPAMQVANTQLGPSLAYDATFGYAIAVLERTTNTLFFTSSTDGSVWTSRLPIVQEGTTGWYPSVAIDPTFHEPTIAYYHCAQRAGIAEGSCPATENQLRLVYHVPGNWRGPNVVDPQGGLFPKLAFLATGRRVIAYRSPANGSLKLFADP